MTARTIGDDQLGELLELLKGSDTVELKLTVPDGGMRSAAESLGMDLLDGEIRQVVFFDTPDLALDKAGVVVRARRIQGGGGDSVVKRRPVTATQLPELRRWPSLGVEVDAMPGGFVCSASIKSKARAAAVRKVIRGKAGARELFSKEQRAFYKEHVPDGLKLRDLAILGPINLVKLKFSPKGFGQKMVAEVWFYPDGSRLLELSTKCLPADALQAAAETRAFLTGRGVDLTGEQQTKTRKSLRYYAKRFAEAESAA